MQIVRNHSLNGYLRSRLATLAHAIQTAPNNQFTSPNKDLFINSLIQQYSIEPLQLYLDREEISSSQKQVSASEL
jgi:hypothetical protein